MSGAVAPMPEGETPIRTPSTEVVMHHVSAHLTDRFQALDFQFHWRFAASGNSFERLGVE